MNSKCCQRKLFKDYLGHIRCSECLLISSPKTSFRMAYIAILMIFLCSWTLKSHDTKDVFKYSYNIPKDSCDIELSDSNVLRELKDDSCIFPEIALKQIHLESNWYKSDVCKQNHNLLGLKCNCKYTKGFKSGHSNYTSYRNCLKCYTQFFNQYWYKYFNNYAEVKNYKNLIIKQQ